MYSYPLSKAQVDELNAEMRELLKYLAGPEPRELSAMERGRLDAIYSRLSANDAAIDKAEEKRMISQEYRLLKDKPKRSLSEQRRLEYLHNKLYGTGYKARRLVRSGVPRWSSDHYGALEIEVKDGIL